MQTRSTNESSNTRTRISPGCTNRSDADEFAGISDPGSSCRSCSGLTHVLFSPPSALRIMMPEGESFGQRSHKNTRVFGLRARKQQLVNRLSQNVAIAEDNY